jgi:ribosomal protein L20A (L18A)
MSSEVKIFLVSGNYVKNKQKFTFNKNVRALTPAQAKELVLCTITSIKLLRRKVNITEIKEVPAEQCTDLFIKNLAEM